MVSKNKLFLFILLISILPLYAKKRILYRSETFFGTNKIEVAEKKTEAPRIEEGRVLYQEQIVIETKTPKEEPKFPKGMFKDENGILFTDGSIGFKSNIPNNTLVKSVSFLLNDYPAQFYGGEIVPKDEGENLILFQGFDEYGRLQDSSKFRVVVDKTPPMQRYYFEGNLLNKLGILYIHPETKLVVEAFDSGSGIKEILLSTNYGEYIQAKDSKNTFKQDGNYIVQIKSNDNVGNISDIETIRFIVDSTPPSIKSRLIYSTIFNTENQSLCERYSKLELTAMDTGIGVKEIQYKRQGDEIWIPYSNPIQIPDNSKDFKLLFRAIDYLGNISENYKFSCEGY
ncbi:MAG: hypothetical protein SFU98_12270 [Leptospiraceae bacterium]|nr:hypothetical protein [Leptospiraceae bacterium]